MAEKGKFGGKFALVVGLTQLLFFVLFGVFVEYDKAAMPRLGLRHSEETSVDREHHVKVYYSFFQDIHVMIFFGIGFLYCFMKKYCLTGVSMCLLLAAITIETALLVQNVWLSQDGKVPINIISLIMTEFAAASSLIALGGVFGKISPLQMVVFVIAETIFYSLNEHWSLKLLQVSDLGESVALHLFASLFGLSVAFAVDKGKRVTGNPNEGTSYSSNLFCMIGTVVLWTLWPSFNAVLSHGDAQQRSALNTFLALVASGVSAFIMSSLVNKEKKFSTSHIQNATLAGGVAIGATADLMVHPVGALVIGSVGGIISVAGFEFATPFLNKNMRVYDPCGINSLHAIPGLFGGVLGAIFALMASKDTYGYSLYTTYPAMAPMSNTTELLAIQMIMPMVQPGSNRSALLQSAFQLAYIFACIVTSIVTGLLTGFVVRQPMFDPLDEDQMYTDAMFWVLPYDATEIRTTTTKDEGQCKL